MTASEKPKTEQRALESEDEDHSFKILSLDGGGAKGFYTLGVLRELESMAQKPLHQVFDLIYGTSTGAIIAALIALGHSITEIHDLYIQHIPHIMKMSNSRKKSQALADLANNVFGDKKFNAIKTGIGIVTTKWTHETPMIFKGDISRAHGRTASFVPGFGCTIGDAVQASCSAHPYFEKKKVTTSTGDRFVLVDGGYCANNPTLYAIADAVAAIKCPPEDLRVVSIGVGDYPSVQHRLFSKARLVRNLPSVQLLEKTFAINTQSMEQLRRVLFANVQTVRVSGTYHKPEFAADLFEHNLTKLDVLHQLGAESFAEKETQIRELLSL